MNANLIGLDDDPLRALIDPHALARPAASVPKSVDAPVAPGNGLSGVVLAALVMALFFAMVPFDTPNARPIDMTGIYPVAHPIPLPDVLGIECVDRDIVAGR